MPSCAVYGCQNRNNPLNLCNFFRIPEIDERPGFKELSEERRSAWLSALKRSDTNPTSYRSLQVCQDHFISGKLNVCVCYGKQFYFQNNFFQEKVLI